MACITPCRPPFSSGERRGPSGEAYLTRRSTSLSLHRCVTLSLLQAKERHEAACAAQGCGINSMDLTTIAIAVLLALGLVGADTVINSGSVAIEVAIAPKVDAISIDETTLADEFQDQFDAISSTRSLLRPLEVRSRDEQGIGMAMMEALNARMVGYALQR